MVIVMFTLMQNKASTLTVKSFHFVHVPSNSFVLTLTNGWSTCSNIASKSF